MHSCHTYAHLCSLGFGREHVGTVVKDLDACRFTAYLIEHLTVARVELSMHVQLECGYVIFWGHPLLFWSVILAIKWDGRQLHVRHAP